MEHVYTIGRRGRIDGHTAKIGLLPNPSGITTMTQKRSNGRARGERRRRALQFQLYRETVTRASKGGRMLTRMIHGRVVLVAPSHTMRKRKCGK